MSIERQGPGTAATTMTGLARFGGQRRFYPRLAWFGRLAALIAVWYRRWEQRSALAELDGHLLRDIGKTRNQALDEAAKPFWQP